MNLTKQRLAMLTKMDTELGFWWTNGETPPKWLQDRGAVARKLIELATIGLEAQSKKLATRETASSFLKIPEGSRAKRARMLREKAQKGWETRKRAALRSAETEQAKDTGKAQAA